MQSKVTYQLKWVRTLLQLRKPNQTKKPKPSTPQKQRAKHMELFWKSPFAEIQNLKVLSQYMIMEELLTEYKFAIKMEALII